MRVLHINTHDSGGAAIACKRLHYELIKQGIHSDVLTLFKGEKLDSHFFLDHNWHFLARLRHSVGERLVRNKLRNLKRKISYAEVISWPKTPFDISKHPLFKKADIIHLHWVGGFLDYGSFFERCEKPIVWTLHDLNPFSGLFHYEEDAKRNAFLIGNLDVKITAFKQLKFDQAKRLNFVALNYWMKDKLKEALPKVENISVIPNGIPVNQFIANDKLDMRLKYSIPQDKKIILFVGDINNRRKGFDLISEVFNDIDDNNILLCTIGQKCNGTNRILHLGKMTGDQQVVEAYSLADVLVVPSLEDNQPNTIIEGMACGLPIIGFNVGGISEIIEKGKTGEIVDAFDLKQFKEKMLKLLANHKNFGKEARMAVVDRFGSTKSGSCYIELYNGIIEK